MPKKSDKTEASLVNKNNDIDGGQIGNGLNSDNSFSDQGLENARLLNEAINKENSN